MKHPWGSPVAAATIAWLLFGAAPSTFAQVDSGVIRLAPRARPVASEAPNAPDAAPDAASRHGFDVTEFDNRFESLWFQRKLFQSEGRDEEAARQSDSIRAFIAEEGVQHLRVAAGALLIESRRWDREGSYTKALDALALAEALDPGRPQIALARARVFWSSGAGPFAAGAEAFRAAQRAIEVAFRELDFVHGAALIALAALLATVALFALVMMLRYQTALRHDVEESLVRSGRSSWAKAGGWGVLLLPFALWVGAGWIAIYWLAATFRYMRRAERALAAVLLVATALSVPAYRFAVGLFGLSADPTIRTALAAGNGGYDPDRIGKLRELVETYPDDPLYRFLLAGLYKNGRFFADAFDEYGRVLEQAPSTYQARINLGNIYATLGQYGEAISNYRKALEIRPTSALAYYNMYLAQSDSFKLKEATESLANARNLDGAKTTAWLTSNSRDGRGTKTIDAVIEFDSVWRATIDGRSLRTWLEAEPESEPRSHALSGLLSGPTIASLLGLVACGVMLTISRGRTPAQRCTRCGQAFCVFCKPRRDGPEYCSQCAHLFVSGDGLSPESKSMKLYEIERHAARTSRVRRIASAILPGSSHVLAGRAWLGCGLIVLWLLAWVAGFPEGFASFERLFGTGLRISDLRPAPIPDVYRIDAVLLLAFALGLAVWIAGNVSLSRTRKV